jgi:hypothetical protein
MGTPTKIARAVSDEDIDAITIVRANFHGEWNQSNPSTAQKEELIPDSA